MEGLVIIILHVNDTVKPKISKLLSSLATAFLYKQSIFFQSAQFVF